MYYSIKAFGLQRFGLPRFYCILNESQSPKQGNIVKRC